MTEYEKRPKTNEVDDFMANLLGRTGVTRTHVPSSTPNRRQAQRPIMQPQPHTRSVKRSDSQQPTAHKRRRSKIVPTLIVGFTVLALIIGGGVFVFKGPLQSIITPKSPFTQEQQSKMGVPLFYPTKLPGTYKMELGSITQPEADVLLYALSSDDGKRINVTLQKQPDGLDLSPLYATLKDIHEISTTTFGSVKVGTSSSENIVIANILTGKTWIIVSGNTETLTDTLLKDIIDSLRA